MSTKEIADPCGEFGPTQRWALVWFFAAIAFGSFLTFKLACFDRGYYDSDGYVLDYTAYSENRSAATTIGVERVDPRARGTYSTAVTRAAQQ